MRRASVAGLVLVVVACGGSTNTSGTGSSGGNGGAGASGGSGGTGASGGSAGSGASGGSGGSSASGGSGGCEAIVPCCDDQTGEEVPWRCEGTEPVCPPGSSWPGGSGCGPAECTPTKPCPAGHWCDYADDQCGRGGPGVCKAHPESCDLLYAPVCACDGSVAGNQCGAQMSGYDVDARGTCTPPADMFACGTRFCWTGQQYCFVVISDVGGIPNEYACKTFPAACGNSASCSCLSNEPCGDICQADASGNLTLTCPGG